MLKSLIARALLGLALFLPLAAQALDPAGLPWSYKVDQNKITMGR